MSAPRILLVVGILIVFLFAVAVAAGSRDRFGGLDADWVGGVKRTVTGSGAFKAEHVAAGTTCFVNNVFDVEGECIVVIPKRIRRVRLQVKMGQATAVLEQNKGDRPGTGYEVISADIEPDASGLMQADLKGDGGTLVLKCPTACRLAIAM